MQLLLVFFSINNPTVKIMLMKLVYVYFGGEGAHLMSLLSNEINVPSYRSRSPRGTLAMTQSGSSL